MKGIERITNLPIRKSSEIIKDIKHIQTTPIVDWHKKHKPYQNDFDRNLLK